MSSPALPDNVRHAVLQAPLKPPFTAPGDKTTVALALVAMGCFWGAERIFWQKKGVISTAVGYIMGEQANPSYEEVCTGETGHAECVLVAFNPNEFSYSELLKTFWENHDPTQGMRQGNDVGSQYRSGIYCTNEDQFNTAKASLEKYQSELSAKNFGKITTEIEFALAFYYADETHQQYLAKNPDGYCGIGGTGVSCPIGL